MDVLSDDDDDASSCTSAGASADGHIERAEFLPLRQCSSLLTTLVGYKCRSSIYLSDMY